MTRDEVKQLKVVVLGGGWSDERDISMMSAHACHDALLEAGFTTVDLLDVASDGFVGALVAGTYDVAFVAMHGRWGEDGCIQGLLEVLHMPYTFSGVLASALGTEKDVAKTVYRAAGVPCPRGIDVPAGMTLSDEQVDKLIVDLGFPMFVKPAGNGSSFGVTEVNERKELADALATAGSEGGRVLIEECIKGTEITVPVIGNDDAHALPIVEIVTGAEFYDLKVKYEPSSMHHVIPARLEPGVYTKAQALAVRAHQALGCRGASRTDFIVTDKGEPIALETNTIPGMTPTSLLPDSARHGGIEFPELCTRFIEYALEEHSEYLR